LEGIHGEFERAGLVFGPEVGGVETHIIVEVGVGGSAPPGFVDCFGEDGAGD